MTRQPAHELDRGFAHTQRRGKRAGRLSGGSFDAAVNARRPASVIMRRGLNIVHGRASEHVATL